MSTSNETRNERIACGDTSTAFHQPPSFTVRSVSPTGQQPTAYTPASECNDACTPPLTSQSKHATTESHASPNTTHRQEPKDVAPVLRDTNMGQQGKGRHGTSPCRNSGQQAPTNNGSLTCPTCDVCGNTTQPQLGSMMQHHTQEGCIGSCPRRECLRLAPVLPTPPRS